MVQIYVDDIIFDATNQGLCDYFAKDIQNEFEMSKITILQTQMPFNYQL